MTTDQQTVSIFPATRAYSQAVAQQLPLDDQQAFEDAKQGWLTSFPEGGVKPGASAGLISRAILVQIASTHHFGIMPS